MSKKSVTLAASVAAKTLLKLAVKPRHSDGYLATLMAKGVWGAGTLALFLSDDGGTTFAPIMDTSGAAVTKTDDFSLNITLGIGNSSKDSGIGIYYTFTGATNPSLILTLSDNKG